MTLSERCEQLRTRDWMNSLQCSVSQGVNGDAMVHRRLHPWKQCHNTNRLEELILRRYSQPANRTNPTEAIRLYRDALLQCTQMRRSLSEGGRRLRPRLQNQKETCPQYDIVAFVPIGILAVMLRVRPKGPCILKAARADRCLVSPMVSTRTQRCSCKARCLLDEPAIDRQLRT